MLKPLTAMARAELELDALWAGKTWAFTVRMQGSFVGLGIATANEAGYSPIPMNACHGDSYMEMADHADMLNKEWLGLDANTAARIICSSMAAGTLEPR